jgi:crossover junction endodeoxyribonuclease RuvC
MHLKQKKEITILGIDPGTATTGWGVVVEKNGTCEVVAYGAIETSKNKENVARLKEIANDLEVIIAKYKPDEVGIEDLFFCSNVTTAVKVAQARGVMLLICARARLPIGEYTPLQVKQALTGYGKADKTQVQQMVKQFLKLKKIPKPDDAADALAVAICHQSSRKIKSLNQTG